ncbi:leucine-rich repeat-containing protein 15-like isoform X1 [Tribolium castaneum]|uniref:leucine-rich repeat-containing protein 15-like isoform X1 n=1 Tax=Tribolium castaneum TaxID=7070 RepID=UPI00077DC6A3|nr:PREDICTED: leucine-rich repeat-containing protein 15-like [Tribolium castaneum]|eukprot:XP_015833805.1 PREDICTED: leucine-rich repeat-containing protein 15-like [Tribolium castaneum]
MFFESIFLLILVVNPALSSLWEDSLPEISDIELRKEPLQINETYTQVKLDNVTGTLYATSLSKLSKITDLQIYTNGLEDVEDGAFCSPPILKNFEIIFNTKEKLLTITKNILKGCDKLEGLVIVTEPDNMLMLAEDALENLPNLRNLQLMGFNLTQLSPNYFKNLNSLQILTIRSCNVARIEPNFFKNLPNLKDLEISWNEITELPQNLFKNSSKLEVLSFYRNNLTNVTWDEFDGLKSLTYLHVGSNQITSFNAEKIARYMPNLTELDFPINPLDCKKREAFANELIEKLNRTIKIRHKFDPGYHDSCEVYDVKWDDD